MQKILWLGEPYFSDKLADCGWETVFAHKPAGYRIFSWDDLIRLADFTPDVLVVADASTPPPVLGVENFPCLTVFYSVDSHIHSWQPFYAQAFDACLVSLRDHLEWFNGKTFLAPDRVWWSPAFARTLDLPDPSVPKTRECLFVGTNDKNLMPARYAFLERLSALVPGLQIESGDYRRLFQESRVLLNQAEHGDLNFRVFEAMGCGGCLVTPRIGHGLASMFVDGEHLVSYAPDDAGDAAYRINFLLQHPELCEHIGEQALQEVNAHHRAIHRAQAFTDHLCDIAIHGIEDTVAARQALAPAIRESALTMLYLLNAGNMSDAYVKDAFLAAARGKFGLDGIQD